MSSFKNLTMLPIYDLYNELLSIIEDNKVEWGKSNQICINTIKGKEDNYHYGNGSLYYDWDTAKTVNGKIEVKPRATPLVETDFTEICEIFKGSLFEIVFNSLKQYYVVGRVRVMRSMPKTCLTWHVDDTIRVHYPLKTQDGCLMIIEDEVKHLPKYTWWETNTLIHHTALNASVEDRIHLVATIIEKK
jgi:hypothetical protein